MSQPKQRKSPGPARGLDPRSSFIHQVPSGRTVHTNCDQHESSQDSSPEHTDWLGCRSCSSNDGSVQSTTEIEGVEPSYLQPTSTQQPPQPHTTPTASCCDDVHEAIARDYIMHQPQQPQQPNPGPPYRPHLRTIFVNREWMHPNGRYVDTKPAYIGPRLSTRVHNRAPIYQGWGEASYASAVPVARTVSPQPTKFDRQGTTTVFNDQDIFQIIKDVENAIKEIEEELEDLKKKMNIVFRH